MAPWFRRRETGEGTLNGVIEPESPTRRDGVGSPAVSEQSFSFLGKSPSFSEVSKWLTSCWDMRGR